MNTITWLIIGHLVGDWMLQNNWMAKGKKTAFFALPGIVHYLIYTLVVLSFLLLGGFGISTVYILVAGLILFFTHWLIDATNLVERWMRFYRQTETPSVRLMVDQTFHMLVLTLIAIILPVS